MLFDYCIAKQTRKTGMTLRWLIAAILLMPLAGYGNDEEDLKAAVIARCMYDAAEFGEELIRTCVESDLAAAKALEQYPASTKEIVSRCTRNRQNYGWSMVKVCVDMDIAAETALAAYDAKLAPLIDECRAKAAKLGPANIKGCVDRSIEMK